MHVSINFIKLSSKKVDFPTLQLPFLGLKNSEKGGPNCASPNRRKGNF